MPFAVFRRHQRKLLAIFAILAMFGFVLADSLPRLLGPGSGGGGKNPVVATLYGKSIRQSDLNEMQVQRVHANQFVGVLGMILGMGPVQDFFGPTSTRDLVDALILEHEADALKMPTGPDIGREWLKQATGGRTNREIFESALGRFGNQVSGEHLLTEISNQARLRQVRSLLGNPVVTPLDVFHAYRDQNERVAAKIAAFPVDAFLAKVPEPTAAEVQALYDQYKDRLPDPDADAPGFKVPRQVRVESLSIDGNALLRGLQDQLKEPELRAYYDGRKAEYKIPSAFPDEIFLGRPDLTPPLYKTFEEVRPYLSTSLAEDKAQAEIVARFGALKDDVLIPFADKYHDALDARTEAEKSGTTSDVVLPKPESLEPLAKAPGLQYEKTPLLDREQAEHYGEIANAEVGLTRLGGGRKFAAEFFDSKSGLFEPIELTDPLGRRYLARKVEDNPPHIPALESIRPQVVLAWKTLKARPLAEQAAQAFAEAARKDGGTIKEEVVNGRPVIATPPLTKLQPGFPIPGQMFQTGPPTLTEIPQVSNPGDAFRDAYFGLQKGTVAVAPNQPKSVYYVLTLAGRVPASFQALYAPNGDYLRFRSEAMFDAARHRDQEEMARLRTQAGLRPDWVPGDEAKRDASS